MQMTTTAPDTGTTLLLYIEIVGTIIGLVMIVALFRVYRGLGGVIAASLLWQLLGAVLFTAAFGVSAVINWLNITTMENSMVVHMGLMTVAMILAVFAAIKSASLLK